MKNKFVLATLLLSTVAFFGACSNTCRLSKVDSKAIYAVAMTNGSLFFGNISGQDRNNIYMKDVYYFKRTDVPNPANPKETKPNLSLVAQFDDFYAPQDTISLNRDHIIYFQPLQDSSKVIELIGKIKAQRAAQAQAPAPAPASAPAPTAPSN